MNKVANILSRKGDNVISVTPDTTVYDALTLMSKRNIGSIAVLNEKGKYLGLLTERDYARKVIVQGRHSNDTMVKDIMSTDLPPVTKNHTVEECMELMSKNNIRYLPVIENDKLMGLISVLDLVNETIQMQKETIEQLKNYISQ